MAKMKSLFRDSLWGYPSCSSGCRRGENGGLVSTPSAIWGDFQGALAAKGRRGVSYGDAIGLKREDYKGFDLPKTYANMIFGLRQGGC